MTTEPTESVPADASADHLAQELHPQINAIVKMAELLNTKVMGDENVQQIVTAARGLLDVVSRQSAHPRGEVQSGRESTDQCDVLHIEDNSRIFASVKLLLESERALKVVQATNGKTGFALAQTRAPKLILLDLDLPDIHGSEVIQHLQKDPVTTRIPVVVISGDATPSQIERLLVLGARNYMTKPIRVQPFLAVIDEIFQDKPAA